MARGKREKEPKKRTLKRILKVILIIIIIAVLAVGGYVGYMYVTYDRIEDNMETEIDNPTTIKTNIPLDKKLQITSWNIGFAAYLQDYSFFMDGGKESRARSEESVIENMDNIAGALQDQDSDLYLIQEVDYDSTRTYKVDQRKILRDAFRGYSYTFAQNYNSSYILYPFNSPHGANKAGLVTLCDYKISTSIRRSLPIQTNIAKFMDLDRCYDIMRIPAEGGRDLVLINLHLSAYTTDPTIADKQLDMIYEEIAQERMKGNYVICGGDFNKDLIGDCGACFGVKGEEQSWCKPFKRENLPDGFSLIVPYDKKENIPSNRVADAPYDPKTTFCTTLDGFIVSDNVEVVKAGTVQYEFKYSDHNPVNMSFKLKSDIK